MGVSYSFNDSTGNYEPQKGASERSLKMLTWVAACVVLGSISGMAYGVSKAAQPRKLTVDNSSAAARNEVKTPESRSTDQPYNTVVGLLEGSFAEPRLQGVRFGAYAGEAALVAGLTSSNIPAMSNRASYIKYRQSVRNAYGIDLEDMNYFSVGARGWESRLPQLRSWILMAGEFGEVTIALEPTGPRKYGVFKDSAAMDTLRDIFLDAEERGITVVVRFASEANLKGNPYSAYGSRKQAKIFFDAALWFKRSMPSNVKMVFSPLINTAVHGEPLQKKTVEWMLLGPDDPDAESPWDRIGGTIYRTNVRLDTTFERYYEWMTNIYGDAPFQICEVGGPYGKRGEIKNFVSNIVDGRWPGVEKVNLFARDINRRADPNGHFGFMNPTERERSATYAAQTGEPQVVESYMKPLFTGASD